MTSPRKGDRILDQGGKVWTVTHVPADLLLRVDSGGLETRLAYAHGVTILCCQCERPAELFGLDFDAYCEEHAPEGSTPVRRDPDALAWCVCGDALDHAKVEGKWDLGGVVAEYRTCLQCGSTRAFMPPDVIEGEPVELWEDGRRQGEPVFQNGVVIGRTKRMPRWAGILDATEESPVLPTMTLVRAGKVVATVVEGPGTMAWFILPPSKNHGTDSNATPNHRSIEHDGSDERHGDERDQEAGAQGEGEAGGEDGEEAGS